MSQCTHLCKYIAIRSTNDNFNFTPQNHVFSWKRRYNINPFDTEAHACVGLRVWKVEAITVIFPTATIPYHTWAHDLLHLKNNNVIYVLDREWKQLIIRLRLPFSESYPGPSLRFGRGIWIRIFNNNEEMAPRAKCFGSTHRYRLDVIHGLGMRCGLGSM